jgi:hypothetical protein
LQSSGIVALVYSLSSSSSGTMFLPTFCWIWAWLFRWSLLVILGRLIWGLVLWSAACDLLVSRRLISSNW